MHRTDRRKITLISIIGTLGVGDISREFRDEEVQIRVALTMRVCRLVDRHAIDKGTQIGAMVQIIAAQQELIGFAFATVARDLQPGHRFEQLSHSECRVQGKFVINNDAFAGTARHPQEPQPFRGHVDLVELIARSRWLRFSGHHSRCRTQGCQDCAARLVPKSTV